MRHSISQFWRKKDSYYFIKLTRCRRCGRVSFPGREVCPFCGSRDVETFTSRGRGRVVSYTVSYFRREGEEESTPRIIGLIELEEDVKVPGEIVDVEPSEIEEGMEVEAVLRRFSSDNPYGLIYYGLKFIPVLKK